MTGPAPLIAVTWWWAGRGSRARPRGGGAGAGFCALPAAPTPVRGPAETVTVLLGTVLPRRQRRRRSLASEVNGGCPPRAARKGGICPSRFPWKSNGQRLARQQGAVPSRAPGSVHRAPCSVHWAPGSVLWEAPAGRRSWLRPEPCRPCGSLYVRDFTWDQVREPSLSQMDRQKKS